MDKNIFVALVQAKTINGKDWDEAQVEGEASFKAYLAALIGEFTSAIAVRMDKNDACYLLTKQGSTWSRTKLLTSSEEKKCISDCFKKISKLGTDEIFNEDSLAVCVAFMTKGIDHWDYNFLKLSGHTSGTITILGKHPRYEQVARQIFDSGDYDTGIEVADGEEDSYLGENALGPYELSDNLFKEEFYK